MREAGLRLGRTGTRSSWALPAAALPFCPGFASNSLLAPCPFFRADEMRARCRGNTSVEPLESQQKGDSRRAAAGADLVGERGGAR